MCFEVMRKRFHGIIIKKR
jgi:hypothetical protein